MIGCIFCIQNKETWVFISLRMAQVLCLLTVIVSFPITEYFVCKAVVDNVTSNSADITWPAGPGAIDHYRVEVITEGNVNVTHVSATTFYYNLSHLTAGAHYSVQVVPVKCERDMRTEKVDFNTSE